MTRWQNFLLFCCACSGGMTVAPQTPVLKTSVLVKTVGTPLTPVSTEVAGVQHLGLAAGEPVALTTTSILALKAGNTPVGMPVGESGDSSVLAPIEFFTAREQSAFAGTANGLFSLSGGRWLKSPLSLEGLSTASSIGSGTAEEVWLAGSFGVKFWTGNALQDIEVSFPQVPSFRQIESVMAMGNGRAIVSGAQQVLFVDASAQTVKWLAKDLGAVVDSTRKSTGEAVLAFANGLLEVSPTGEAAWRTSDAPIVAVSTNGTTVFALSGNDIVRVNGDTAETVGTVSKAAAKGLVVSSDQAPWALDGAAVKRFQSAKSVSFEKDVKPFTTAKCQTCHNGAYAPLKRFDTFDVAKARAEEIVHRLKNDDARFALMPPTSAGTLTPQEYDVFIRWTQGGFAP